MKLAGKRPIPLEATVQKCGRLFFWLAGVHEVLASLRQSPLTIAGALVRREGVAGPRRHVVAGGVAAPARGCTCGPEVSAWLSLAR